MLTPHHRCLKEKQVVCSILEAMLHVQSAQAAPFDREQPEATANVQPE
jgi:predicted secreted Zn-dependent protease